MVDDPRIKPGREPAVPLQLSKSFRKAEKTSPKSLKSAENTIADAAASVSHTSSGGCGSSRNQGSRIETHGRGRDVGDLHRKKLLGSDTLNDVDVPAIANRRCGTLVQSDGKAYKIVSPYHCYENITVPGLKPIPY